MVENHSGLCSCKMLKCPPLQDPLSTRQDSAALNFQGFRELPRKPEIPKDYCYGYWRKKKNGRCVVIVFPKDFLAALGLFWHLVVLWSKYLWKLLWSPGAEHRDHLLGETQATSSQRAFVENTGKPQLFGVQIRIRANLAPK